MAGRADLSVLLILTTPLVSGLFCWAMKGLLLALGVQTVLGSMLLLSPAFKNFQDIPSDYACDPFYSEHRVGPSPPLEWVRAPEKTRSFALIVDDTDFETVHWLVSNIPASATKLEVDATRFGMPAGSMEYVNSFGDPGFGTFCPINVTHTIRFRLYALRVANFSFAVEFGQNLTTAMVEHQISALGSDILYVAPLVGKIYVQGYDPFFTVPPPPPEPVSIPRFNQPIPQRRFVKPSETLKHLRPHNNPRPLNETEMQHLCKRFNNSETSRFFAKLCTSGDLPDGAFDRIEQIDGGGAEQPDASVSEHRLHSGQANVQIAARPNLAPVKLGVGAPVKQDGADLKEFLDDSDGLISWECGQGSHQPLTLRSPVLDLCQTEGYPVLPAEFVCDTASPEELRATPPFVWKLSEDANKTCAVQSFSLVLEDAHTRRIHWIVNGIPPTQRSLGVSLAGTDLEVGVEALNSFHVDSYQAPCSTGGSPSLYRFHLFALPIRMSQFSVTTNSQSISTAYAGACQSTFVDFAVAGR